MATHIALQPKKKTPPIASEAAPEEIMKLLVDRIAACPKNAGNAARGPEHDVEEVIFDAVLDGGHYLLVRLPVESRPRTHLSPREQEIVRMVAQGHPNKVIAGVLNISSWTVCTHMRRIFAKLGVGSRAAMVARILEIGNTREPAAQVLHLARDPASPGKAAVERQAGAPPRKIR
jgi:DNA-binding CsgD family transcriptional regulator